MFKSIIFSLCGLLVSLCPFVFTGEDALATSPPRSVPDAPVNPRATRFSDTSIQLKWGRVEYAESYKVLRLSAGKWRVVGITSGTVWVNKGLPQRKAQTYRVVSCSQSKGAGMCGSPSILVSAMTYRKKDNVVNAGKVLIEDPAYDKSIVKENQKSPVLGINDYWMTKIIVEPAKWGLSKQKQVWNTRLTYSSSNPRVASVDAKGLIKGRGLGTAVITVRSHNGNLAKTRVTVKDFTASLTAWSHSGMFRGVKEITSVYSRTIEKMTRYELSHAASFKAGCLFQISEDGNSLNGDSCDKVVVPQWIKDDAYQMLSDPVCPYQFRIFMDGYGIQLLFALNGYYPNETEEENSEFSVLKYNIRRYPNSNWTWKMGYNHWEQSYSSGIPKITSPR